MNDRLGSAFKDALVARAKAGIRVHFLFDEIGSLKLPSSYLREMREAGIQCRSFGTNRYWWSRLQINFRNHRKVVIVDGEDAFVGGLNVGDDYAAVGTANLDNRSFHLNFEITALSSNPAFLSEIETMLSKDFQEAREATVEDFNSRSFLFRAACRGARLMAPAQ